MKKVCFVFIILMLFSFNISNVDAYSKGDFIGTHSDSQTGYSGYGVEFYSHDLTISGSTKNIICLQPGYAAKRDGGNLYVRLKYTYDNSIDVKA